MITVLLVIHLLIAIAMVTLILLQRSEGGALGIGGGGGGGGFMTGRQAGNVLTKSTGILAAAFFTTSLVLAILAAHDRADAKTILDDAVIPGPAAPAAAAKGGTSSKTAAPSAESAPAAAEPSAKPAPAAEPSAPVSR